MSHRHRRRCSCLHRACALLRSVDVLRAAASLRRHQGRPACAVRVLCGAVAAAVERTVQPDAIPWLCFLGRCATRCCLTAAAPACAESTTGPIVAAVSHRHRRRCGLHALLVLLLLRRVLLHRRLLAVSSTSRICSRICSELTACVAGRWPLTAGRRRAATSTATSTVAACLLPMCYALLPHGRRAGVR